MEYLYNHCHLIVYFGWTAQMIQHEIDSSDIGAFD